MSEGEARGPNAATTQAQGCAFSLQFSAVVVAHLASILCNWSATKRRVVVAVFEGVLLASFAPVSTRSGHGQQPLDMQEALLSGK